MSVTSQSKIFSFCRSFLIALVLAFFSFPPASAQSGAIIHPNPAQLEVGAGQVEALNIIIENVKDLYGVEIRAHFDPNVVEVVGANSTQETIQLVPGSFVQPDFLVRNTADNKKGTLEYVLTQTNPTPPANGTGVLVTIQFRGKVLGKSSPFVIDHVQFSDRHGQTIPVTSQNGKITVIQPKPPTPTPTLKVTPTLAPTETPEANPTDAPANSTASSSGVKGIDGNSLLDAMLILVSCCGFLGAFLVVAIAAFIFFRRPKRSNDPWGRDMQSQWR